MNKYEILVGAMLEHIHELNSHQFLGNYNITEELSDLEDAIELAGLTEKQHESVRLVYYKDMTHREAAEALRNERSVISRHIKAAIRKIAQVYQHWEDVEDVN